MAAKSLVLTGYGINSEEETSFAFEAAGFQSTVRHINDLTENPDELNDVQVLCIPGGFSYGDDTGSGNALRKDAPDAGIVCIVAATPHSASATYRSPISASPPPSTRNTANGSSPSRTTSPPATNAAGSMSPCRTRIPPGWRRVQNSTSLSHTAKAAS